MLCRAGQQRCLERLGGRRGDEVKMGIFWRFYMFDGIDIKRHHRSCRDIIENIEKINEKHVKIM